MMSFCLARKTCACTLVRLCENCTIIWNF